MNSPKKAYSDAERIIERHAKPYEKTWFLEQLYEKGVFDIHWFWELLQAIKFLTREFKNSPTLPKSIFSNLFSIYTISQSILSDMRMGYTKTNISYDATFEYIQELKETIEELVAS